MALSITMSRVKQRVDAFKLSMKLPARNIALIANISPDKFSNGLLGITYLGCEVEKKLAEITYELQVLEDVVSPMVLPTDPERLRAILDYVKEQQVDVERVRTSMREWFGIAE